MTVTELKDDVMRFLETVTYDEMMAHTYLLDLEQRGDWEAAEVVRKLFIEKYNVDDSRWPLYGKLSNWHTLQIPSSDWRINYFLSLGKGYPEETLYEQFGELKDKGESYKDLVENALNYSNRMIVISTFHFAVCALYPAVFVDNYGIIPLDPGKMDTVAWKDTESIAFKAICDLIDYHLDETLVYQLTYDLESMMPKTDSGKLILLAGSFFKDSKKSQLIGPNGAFLFDKNKPRVSLRLTGKENETE